MISKDTPARDLKARPAEDVAKSLMFTNPDEPDHRIILDMGEASREEGFRLNGCR